MTVDHSDNQLDFVSADALTEGAALLPMPLRKEYNAILLRSCQALTASGNVAVSVFSDDLEAMVQTQAAFLYLRGLKPEDWPEEGNIEVLSALSTALTDGAFAPLSKALRIMRRACALAHHCEEHQLISKFQQAGDEEHGYGLTLLELALGIENPAANRNSPDPAQLWEAISSLLEPRYQRLTAVAIKVLCSTVDVLRDPDILPSFLASSGFPNVQVYERNIRPLAVLNRVADVYFAAESSCQNSAVSTDSKEDISVSATLILEGIDGAEEGTKKFLESLFCIAFYILEAAFRMEGTGKAMMMAKRKDDLRKLELLMNVGMKIHERGGGR